jgi:hypothetical protein
MLQGEPAAADGPAVEAPNGRLTGFFEHSHVQSDDSLASTGGAPPPAFEFPEEDIEIGGLAATVTLPVAHSLGARLLLSGFGGKRHPDGFDDAKVGGIELGGDLFWRDPEIGHAGIGPRYLWSTYERSGDDDDAHAVGGTVQAGAYLSGFGVIPVDLDARSTILDWHREDIYLDSPKRVYSASGDATFYLSDVTALRTGGRWVRTNGSSGESVVDRFADLGLEWLLIRRPALRLGANLSLGERETSISGVSTFGRFFYALGLSATLSLPGADSLVDLRRRWE